MTLPFERVGAGPPVLLIQGTGLGGGAWAPQVAALREHFEVAWFDNRGLDPATGPCGTTEDMGRDTLEVMDALGWSQAHLVGHSLGGVIAQQAALLAPERVSSLSLMCTFAQGRASLSFDPMSLWRQTKTAVGTGQMRRRAFFGLVSPAALEPTEANIQQLETAFGRGLHEAPVVTMSQVGALLKTDTRDRLAELAGIPSFVLSAEEDHLSPRSEGELLAAGLKTSLTVVPGGHAVTVQDAERVNNLLLAFLQSHAA